MNNNYYEKNGEIIKLNFNIIDIAFIAIFLFTLFNGFFNSLAVAYGYDLWPKNTFLFQASDLHADLVKYVLSFFPEQFPNYHDWKELYQGYYLNNPYGGFENLKNGQLSSYASFPLMIVMCFGLGQFIFIGGPGLLLKFFYIFVIGSTFLTAHYFTDKNTRKALFMTFVMLFSYPVLFILTRGHLYSFLTGLAGIFFIYTVLKRTPIWIPVILLALMANIRPNMLLLAFLFMAYGYKDFMKASFYTGMSAIAIFWFSFSIAQNLLPGYSLEGITMGLQTYSKLYIFGSNGDAFNSSIFGGFKLLAELSHWHIERWDIINKAITISSLLILIFSTILYRQQKLLLYDFAFLVVVIHILATPVFSVYHLIIIFAFLLLKLRNEDYLMSNYTNLILIISVVILSPKNYFFRHDLSLEIIINPVIMLIAISYILFQSISAKKLPQKSL